MKEYSRKVKMLEDILHNKDKRGKHKEAASGYLRTSMERTQRNFSNESYKKKNVGDFESSRVQNDQFNKQKYKIKRNTDINQSSQSEFQMADTKNKRENLELTMLNLQPERQRPKYTDTQLKQLQRKLLNNRGRNEIIKKEIDSIDERSTSQKKDKSPRSFFYRRILKHSALENSKSKIVTRESTERGIKKNICTRQSESQQCKSLTKKKEQINNNRFNLSEKQLKMFGDRFMDKFQKVKLLGRGGFSLVWLGAHRKTREMYAVKQILTKNTHQTHLKEIWFGNFFFEVGGEPREQFIYHSGINNLVKMISYDIQHLDTWVFYQLCNQTLGSALYELRSQVLNSKEKVYKMTYQPLYTSYRKEPRHLKKLIIEISKILCLLSEHNIVHSDIKTENILLKRTSLQQFDYKLTDYGSSFLFSNLKQFSMATPEYMAPQILNFILFQNQLEFDVEMLKIIKEYKNESAIDIWSLGSIVLEIINGIPLWMSIRTKIHYGKQEQNKQFFNQKQKTLEEIKKDQEQKNYHIGLFAVKGRLFDKIVKKQIETVLMIDSILSKQNHSGITVDEQLRYLIKKMLELDPQKRIKPREILNYFGVQINSDKNYFGL